MKADQKLERQLRETWATGLPRYSQLIICRGRIRLIPHRDTGEIRTELWGSGVYMQLVWFGDEIPPTVRDSKIATIIGNVQTYNLNRHVAVRNCLHVPKGGPALGKELRQVIARYTLTPSSYMSAEQVEDLGKRIFERRKAQLPPKKTPK